MIFSTQFGGGAALGSIVQGIGLAEPQYVACDGRPLARAAYPRLSTLFPFGSLTGTVRSIAVENLYAAICASPTYFVGSSNPSATTRAIQFSADGATWSTAGVVTPSCIVASVIWAGTRFVALCTGGYPAIVTTGNNPNSTWIATTSGTTYGVAKSGLAYSPTLGLVAAVGSIENTSIYTLGAGTAWVSRTTPTSLTRAGVCWSGAKFIVANTGSAVIATSTNGVTWAESTLPESITGEEGVIASNGAGAVVISGVASGVLLASSDHGASWSETVIPGVPADNLWRVSYAGDRFFVSTLSGVAMSVDGRSWFLEPQGEQAKVVNAMVAKKGAVFAQFQSTTTAAYSFTESATSFNTPLLQQYNPVVSGNPAPLAYSYIKAL